MRPDTCSRSFPILDFRLRLFRLETGRIRPDSTFWRPTQKKAPKANHIPDCQTIEEVAGESCSRGNSLPQGTAATPSERCSFQNVNPRSLNWQELDWLACY